MLEAKFDVIKSEIEGKFKCLSAIQKLEVLDKIINLCGTSELSYLCGVIHRLQKRDFVSLLPAEVVEKIFGLLDLKTLCLCCLVSKTWNTKVESCESVWRKACTKIGWDNKLGLSTWKQDYVTARKTLGQLINPIHVKTTSVQCQKDPVTAVLKYDNKRNVMATGSIEGNVQLWDLHTNLCIKSVETHSCAVIEFNEEHLFTGSYDNTIACWRWKDGSLMRKYVGHSGAVFSISVFQSENILLSGSSDKLVYLWNISAAQVLEVYSGHQDWVYQVVLCHGLVSSTNHSVGEIVKLSSDKNDIRIWLNTEKSVVLKDFSIESNSTISHMMFNGSQIAASFGEHVLIWNFCDYTLTRRVAVEPSSKCVGLGENWILCVTNHSLQLLSAVCEKDRSMDINSNILAQWKLPRHRKTNSRNNMAVGPSCWLDGKIPVDGQMVFAIAAYGGAVCIMTWRNDK